MCEVSERYLWSSLMDRLSQHQIALMSTLGFSLGFHLWRLETWTWENSKSFRKLSKGWKSIRPTAQTLVTADTTIWKVLERKVTTGVLRDWDCTVQPRITRTGDCGKHCEGYNEEPQKNTLYQITLSGEESLNCVNHQTLTQQSVNCFFILWHIWM